MNKAQHFKHKAKKLTHLSDEEIEPAKKYRLKRLAMMSSCIGMIHAAEAFYNSVRTRRTVKFYKGGPIAEPKEIQNIKNQIGCGYCTHEKTCKKYDPKRNQAKEGCKEWEHHTADKLKKFIS